MGDKRYDGEPPFPGETDDRVFQYSWRWTVTATRTKKRGLRIEISDLRCLKEGDVIVVAQPYPLAPVRETKSVPCGSSLPPDAT